MQPIGFGLALRGGLFVVFAAFDQLLVRREFGRTMRMSRRELRREHRDREGEPRQKQKRKQLHAEFVKASQSLRGVRTLLFVNERNPFDPLPFARPFKALNAKDTYGNSLRVSPSVSAS